MPSVRLFVIVVIALFLVEANAQNWSPELQAKLKIVGSPNISPDGKRVVYTVNETVMAADKSEYNTQVWLASADGKENYQLTFGDKSSTNPKFSPDGSSIAFTSNRKDNRNQIFMLRLAGGEAEQLTDGKGSVTAFDWSPDGNWLAFTMADAKSADEEVNDKGRNDFRWYEENYKLAKLYVVPFAKDSSGKRDVKKLADLNRHVTAFDWSPDGSRITFAHVASPSVNDWPTADVSTVEVATSRITPVAATEASEDNPNYSPDGKWLAISTSDGPPRWAQSDRIVLHPTAGGTPKPLSVTFDAGPGIAGWSPDGKYIRFAEPKGTVSSFYAFDVAANNIAEIDTGVGPGVAGGFSFSEDGKVGAFVWQSTQTPPELFVWSFGNRPVQISKANEEYRKMTVEKTEVVKWKSKDGREIEGLLTYPVGYTAGTKVPLILNVHGGPAGVFQQSYIGGRGVYPLATFASKGYAILRPNPRGSSGYGTEFRRANIKDWGGMDYEDLMTGVDHVIAMGVADANRLGVMGWSYGGYMTSTIITKTKRFKAASAGAPVTNLMSFNGTADIPSFVPDYFGGDFWNDPAIYSKHSAMFNIKNAVTPTLVQHGEADIRVPIEQGYQLYMALKRQNVPTRMLILPRQPHGPNEPKMQIAAMQANLDWFEKYLK